MGKSEKMDLRAAQRKNDGQGKERKWEKSMLTSLVGKSVRRGREGKQDTELKRC